MKRNRTTDSSGGAETVRYHYHLNGGVLYFHRILELEPSFWLTILRACRETDFVQISELHLAADCNCDLMGCITTVVAKGHYEGGNVHPYAYYYFGGTKHKGYVGKPFGHLS